MTLQTITGARIARAGPGAKGARAHPSCAVCRGADPLLTLRKGFARIFRAAAADDARRCGAHGPRKTDVLLEATRRSVELGYRLGGPPDTGGFEGCGCEWFRERGLLT